MRPRTKLQKTVADLSAKLPEVTEKQKQYAYEHCFTPLAYYTKKSAWCSLCGGSFDWMASDLSVALDIDNSVVCPHCGRKLKLQKSRKIKDHEAWYYTVLTTKGGFQVCRNLIVQKTVRKDHKPFMWIAEAFQNWISDDGRETIMARPCSRVMGCNDKWIFNRPMEIKEKSRDPYTPDKYDVFAKTIYPGGNILAKIKKLGYSRRIETLSPCNAFKLLLKDKEAEILAKNGQYGLLGYKSDKGGCNLPFNHAIRIASRNRYIVNDAAMWIDYLRLLEYFHLDTHNAHYVCPKDLKAEHDKLMVKKQKAENRIAYEKKIAEAKKWEAKYQESKGKFFGICFGNENIMITVIQSVAEMVEEGKAMHHCVYTMGYYKKDDSLILSAKDKAGNRIETIELSLKTFKVLQSRGRCNHNTESHSEILELVKKNIHLIKSAV